MLFSDVALSVTGGERIALIGDNGAGKTTFLKLLMNQESPDTGYLRRGPTVRVAYLPQIVTFEDDERSMVDTMLYECKCQPQEARDRLGAFGFRGEDVFKSVSALSGGERSRLKLCMLMGSEINFLVLDEPTNHLDIASREWIEDALSDYGEALLFVSHDRYFIEKFATRIWALSDGVLTDFRGTFEEYRAYVRRQRTLLDHVALHAELADHAVADLHELARRERERNLHALAVHRNRSARVLLDSPRDRIDVRHLDVHVPADRQLVQADGEPADVRRLDVGAVDAS
jgi:ABC-type multidrug transport system ATPase subunit